MGGSEPAIRGCQLVTALQGGRKAGRGASLLSPSSFLIPFFLPHSLSPPGPLAFFLLPFPVHFPRSLFFVLLIFLLVAPCYSFSSSLFFAFSTKFEQFSIPLLLPFTFRYCLILDFRKLHSPNDVRAFLFFHQVDFKALK